MSGGDTVMRDANEGILHAPKRAKAPKDAIKVPPALRARWRDLTVAQLPHLPPVCVAPSATIQAALQSARERHTQYVLIVDNGWLRGYVDMIDLVAQETQGSLDDPVSNIQQPLAGTRRAPRFPTTYRVIHRGTPLAEVAAFLSTAPFALVTDAAPRHVESILTAHDLERYAEVAQLDAPAAPIGSRFEEESRRDRSLVDVLQALDGYAPLIPDEVSDYYLERAGFQCDDVRLCVASTHHPRKRLLALATEKFVADIASDAFQYARIRTNAGPGRSSRPGAAGRDRTRTVLTMEDLSAALGEYGIDARRAETFR
ncbi:hypothetical protein MNAN1_003554 [Malassezia nana]|uniref:CBS domain-containing protein n=1 Tax=Malassezia nana TaxID=180528 RepID=A0AAF0ELC7_9BASI|nr:hypothetical protein MNAN1_003554 [Malassezia nana]